MGVNVWFKLFIFANVLMLAQFNLLGQVFEHILYSVIHRPRSGYFSNRGKAQGQLFLADILEYGRDLITVHVAYDPLAEFCVIDFVAGLKLEVQKFFAVTLSGLGSLVHVAGVTGIGIHAPAPRPGAVG